MVESEKRMVEKVRGFAMQSLSDSPSSHDWDHTLRVLRLCMHIGPTEGGNPLVLQVASYLHDVGRPFEDSSRGCVCHAEKGAAIASDLLADFPLEPEIRSNIIHCIRSHRFRGDSRPATLEAKILFDADKIDGVGASGIARFFSLLGQRGKTPPEAVAWYLNKARLAKDAMQTKEGCEMAAGRAAFVIEFIKRFQEENGTVWLNL